MSIHVSGISISVNMLVCISTEDIQAATQEDTHIQKLKTYIIEGWPHKKEEETHSMLQYWPIRSKLAMTDGITIKGERIIIPLLLQKQILQQLHSNHMCIEEMTLLAHELVYGVNMNADTENTIKQCATCLNTK